MKTMKSIGMMLMAAVVAFGFVACGSDDNNTTPPPPGGDSGTTSSITVNGATFSVFNGYWRANVLNGNEVFYTLQLYNYTASTQSTDPKDIVTVTYKVQNGSQSAIATGEFTNFQVSLTKVSSNSSLDRQYYAFSDQNGNNTKLKVTQSGTGYTVEFGGMKYTDGESTTTFDGTAFAFTGTFTYGTLLQTAGDNRNGSSMTVGDATVSVFNAHWDASVQNGSDTFYTLQFYNFNAVGAVDPMAIVSVVYKVENGSQTAPATGEFDIFDVSFARLSNNSALDRIYSASSTLNGNNGAKLRVNGSGASYTVEFSGMKYADLNGTLYNGTAFNFTGTFAKGLLWQ